MHKLEAKIIFHFYSFYYYGSEFVACVFIDVLHQTKMVEKKRESFNRTIIDEIFILLLMLLFLVGKVICLQST